MTEEENTPELQFGCHRFRDRPATRLCHDCHNTFCEEYSVAHGDVYFCLDCFNSYYNGPDLTADLPGRGRIAGWAVVGWLTCLILAGLALGLLLPVQ